MKPTVKACSKIIRAKVKVDAHGFQCPELLEVFHGKQIERLPGDGHADDEPQHDGRAEVDTDASVLSTQLIVFQPKSCAV